MGNSDNNDDAPHHSRRNYATLWKGVILGILLSVGIWHVVNIFVMEILKFSSPWTNLAIFTVMCIVSSQMLYASDCEL
jgi:hypothetical protein